MCKQFLLAGILSFAPVAVLYAQSRTISYEYDESGNLIEKNIIVFNAAPTKSSIDSVYDASEEKTETFGNIDVVIYPNPTRGLLWMSTSNNMSDKDNIMWSLSDMQGKTLRQGTFQNNSKFSIDLSSFKSGMYLLILRRGGDSRVWKILKQ
ncbi:MAG: T9SS type A sorting domain-containing protein [Bacteroidales bacterium]|jgi:hypothetical protein|nr:T9SS type A sorting domain-containing protein [Bacteroidales bacterium]